MEIVLLVLFPWLAANLLAIASLVLAFTLFRSGSLAIVLALVVGTFGILLSIGQGIPTRGIHPIHLLSWFPVLAACVSAIAWYRTRKCRAELPNKASIASLIPPRVD
jgi:hypothetical protein